MNLKTCASKRNRWGRTDPSNFIDHNQKIRRRYLGLHHLCLRVDIPADVAAVAARLRGAGIAATDAKLYPIYAPDYWATYFTDPEGIRLAVTNYTQERRKRHDNW